MAKTIHEVLDELRASALDERDKGDKFERLMQGYFLTDPEWTRQFSHVWLWSEWLGRDGKPDTGIDLVAEDVDTGELTAIQCKFYAPHRSVQRSDIDKFSPPLARPDSAAASWYRLPTRGPSTPRMH